MERSGYLLDDLTGEPPSPSDRDSNARRMPVPDLWEVEDTPDPDFSSARVLLPPEHEESDDDSPHSIRESERLHVATTDTPASEPEAPTSRRWRVELDNKTKNCPCTGKQLCLAVCLTLVLFAAAAIVTWLYLTGRLLGRKGIFSNKDKGEARLYLIGDERAARTKAYCLDGSRPGYYFSPGTGEGRNKWRVHLDGGGSCDDLEECYTRSLTNKGSTRRLRKRDTFNGFLSTHRDECPEFFNWNLVYVHYCDGSCFSSNRTDPVTYKGSALYFRGISILDAVLDDLTDVRGMTNATAVILSGHSAGATAVYRQADHVRNRLPPTVQFKALPSSGLFVWELDPDREDFFKRRAKLLGMQDGPDLPACLQALEPWKCLLPQFAAPYVTSDMFVLNAAYDSWALKNILKLKCDARQCRGDDLRAMERLRAQVIGITANLGGRQGAFIPSCDDHSIVATSSFGNIVVGGKTPAEAFSDWFFDRTANSSRYIDSTSCCNPTCYV